MKTAGYSGTPLARKLGIGETTALLTVNAPAGYEDLVRPLSPGVTFATRPSPKVDIVHLFATRKEDLAARLKSLRKALRSDAAVWVSWPKKSSKVPTTITEDVIREVALPMGFVDIKVCAVTEVWSGLKLVVRRELR